MSMRHYGVETKALVLSDIEFTKLIWNNRETFVDKYDLLKDATTIEEVDSWDVVEFAYNIDYGTYISEVDGHLILWDDSLREYMKRFSGDCIVIFELKKDNLFEKYENIEEIYREYLERFRELGIKIDISFIKDHFGKLECTYYG